MALIGDSIRYSMDGREWNDGSRCSRCYSGGVEVSSGSVEKGYIEGGDPSGGRAGALVSASAAWTFSSRITDALAQRIVCSSFKF